MGGESSFVRMSGSLGLPCLMFGRALGKSARLLLTRGSVMGRLALTHGGQGSHVLTVSVIHSSSRSLTKAM